MLKKICDLFKRSKLQTAIVAGTMAACCALTTPAVALPFSSISQVVFFGDSLTDSGYNNLWTFPTPLPVGKAPTFTTFGGYVWAQYVARDIKGVTLPVYPGPNPADTMTNNSEYPVPAFVSGTLRGFDYAAAGSTTFAPGFNETWAPSLIQQVEFYEANAGQAADRNAVYFLWSGANDILSALTAATPPTQMQLLIVASNAANTIANEAKRLITSGAQRIVVVTLPNLGVVPLITGLAVSTGQPGLPAAMQQLSFTFNSMLNTALGNVIAQTGAKILLIDSYDLLDGVVAATKAGQPYVVAGQSFTFTNATSPACAGVSQAIYCPSSAPSGYVFADTLHPSDQAHRALSLLVESQIAAWS